MKGDFGVFDRTELLATFCDDVSADEHRCAVLELDLPEHMRSSQYDDLQVCEVPEGYELLHRLLVGLRRSRNQELAVTRCLQTLRAAQIERAEKRNDPTRV